ncbi:UrcA family protein [Gluconacetobacter sp. Hr-1-5]|uniref:UrcA family protein n=1 Tax=Gluconacetobacter sp. Hr-1-5 TaxID=3395370 RepID=UPI003B5193D8
MAPMQADPAEPALGPPILAATSSHPSRRARAIGIGLFILAGLSPVLAPVHPAWAQSSSSPDEITVEGQGEREVQRIAVPYYRPDLATASGAGNLVSRIDRAALTVCGDSTALSGDMRRAIERSDCRRDAMMRAVRDVNDVNVEQAATRYPLPQ